MEKRVAVISDVMMSTGGAENVTEAILEMFPGADFYTLFLTPIARKRLLEKFPKLNIKVSIFQKLIISNNPTKYISIIKIFSWIYWELLDLVKYDLVITSSNSYGSKNVKKGKNSIHISYIHAPPRYLYKEFNQIGWIKRVPWNWVFLPIINLLRWIDKNGKDRPDVIVAASKFVAERIKKYYDRKSVVIYPPVEVEKKLIGEKAEYFVCLSRLVEQKGIRLAVEVCVKNNWPLVVIGDGYERKKLEKMSQGKVKFVGDLHGIDKIKILFGAKALIFTSIEEDFGIVPVEAMALGVPVIAYNSGGVIETVIDGKTGVFFNEYSVESLTAAVNRFIKCKINKQDCVNRAKKFNKKIFYKKMLEVVKRNERAD